MREVSEHCTGERFITITPPAYGKYEECNVKAKCRRYMCPAIYYADRKMQMAMPAEKPCPYFEDWHVPPAAKV